MFQFLSSITSAVASGVWSVISALLILVVAFVVASLVKSLVLKLLGKGKIGQVLDKLDSTDSTGAKAGSTREFIAKLAHLLVFLLFVPGIFNAQKTGTLLKSLGSHTFHFFQFFTTPDGSVFPDILLYIFSQCRSQTRYMHQQIFPGSIHIHPNLIHTRLNNAIQRFF